MGVWMRTYWISNNCSVIHEMKFTHNTHTHIENKSAFHIWLNILANHTHPHTTYKSKIVHLNANTSIIKCRVENVEMIENRQKTSSIKVHYGTNIIEFHEVWWGTHQLYMKHVTLASAAAATESIAVIVILLSIKAWNQNYPNNFLAHRTTTNF